MSKLGIFMADGCEEIEGLTVVDLVRRAGIEIEMISVSGEKSVTGSHKIAFQTDVSKADADFASYDGIVLPGGMPGTLNEEASEQVQAAITYCAEQNRYLTAICAAPSILGHRGLLNGKHAVCYPGFESALTGAEVGTEGVVQDGNIITARGAGVAIDFGLALVAALCGAEKSAEIRKGIVYA